MQARAIGVEARKEALILDKIRMLPLKGVYGVPSV
jgi:hypothetical protein